MKTYHNQRQYSRSQVSIAATLMFEGEEPFGVDVVDLSMGGVFLHTERKFAVGRACKVGLLLGHIKHELPLLADAKVVRLLEHGIALKFNSINVENIEPLQDVIVDHAADPEQAQVEFSKTGGWVFNPD